VKKKDDDEEEDIGYRFKTQNSLFLAILVFVLRT